MCNIVSKLSLIFYVNKQKFDSSVLVSNNRDITSRILVSYSELTTKLDSLSNMQFEISFTAGLGTVRRLDVNRLSIAVITQVNYNFSKLKLSAVNNTQLWLAYRCLLAAYPSFEPLTHPLLTYVSMIGMIIRRPRHKQARLAVKTLKGLPLGRIATDAIQQVARIQTQLRASDRNYITLYQQTINIISSHGPFSMLQYDNKTERELDSDIYLIASSKTEMLLG
jgi:hypothetical protein